jgi:beta-glucuronidase
MCARHCAVEYKEQHSCAILLAPEADSIYIHARTANSNPSGTPPVPAGSPKIGGTMKRTTLLLALGLLSTNAFAEGLYRQTVSLNGRWKFAIDSTGAGLRGDWHKGLPATVGRAVEVPHTWNIAAGTEEYAGLAWYEKEIVCEQEWQKKNVRLNFTAVYHDAVVYVNGAKAGENLHSGYTPFTVDISRFLTPGAVNRIVVSVCNDYSAALLPWMTSFDWVNDGGIIRPVSLEITGRPSLRFVHVTPRIDLADSTGVAEVTLKLWETGRKKARFAFAFRANRSDRVLVADTLLLQAQGGLFTASFDLGRIKPWHFDSPNLYHLETTVWDEESISDELTSVFGFKKLEIREDALYLNGEKVRLPGLEYMPASNPRYGSAEPRCYMDSVVRAMKDLNVCITRFHWQQDDALLDLMDEQGILVQEEVPWWQRPGNLTPELMATARKQVTDNIEAHYNHPSIFAWGLSNEVFGNTERGQYVELRDLVRRLDPERFVTVVSNEIWDRKENDESLICDIPTWNEYIGTWHGKSRDEIPEKFAIIKSAIKQRPLLITEHGLCEPYFTGGDSRRIDEMLFHIREWCKQPFVIGYIYFCLNDYRTQMGEEGIGRFKIRRHGLTDFSLKPKSSYQVFRQLASPIDITRVERSGKSNATVVIRVKEQIPEYTLRSYKIRFHTSDDQLCEILLPELQPGRSHTVELPRINPRFSFEVVRPSGFSVISY